MNLGTDKMNLIAIEAQNFTEKMAEFLKAGVVFNDSKIQKVVHAHLQFLNNNGHVFSKVDFINQTRVFPAR